MGTLDWAITKANEEGGGTINFNVPLPATIMLRRALPIISSTIYIDGPGLDQNERPQLWVKRVDMNMPPLPPTPHFSVFNIAPGKSLSLDELGIGGGWNALGGGIYNRGTLNLSYCFVESNKADSFGGGIYSEGTAWISNSHIQVNSADDTGGGIYNKGVMDIRASNVVMNSAVNYGAGIANWGPAADLVIGDNSSIYANKLTGAAGLGAGIFNFKGAVTMTGGEVYENGGDGNNLPQFGGGVCVNEGDVRLTGVLIKRNAAGVAGGGVAVLAGSLTVTQCTFTENSAPAGTAGYQQGGAFLTDIDCIFDPDPIIHRP